MRYPFIILLSLSLLAGNICYAQFTPAKVVISKEKVTIKGEAYYLHTVERSQTLHSIAKAYGVEVESIVKNNPSVASGLRAGERIYIKDTGNVKAGQVFEEKSEIKHTVRWYENIGSIAQKYGVTEEALIEFNSIKNNAVKTRQVLIIPPASYEVTKVVTESKEVALEKPAEIQKKEEKEEESRTLEPISYINKTLTAALVLPLGGYSEIPDEKSLNFFEFYQGFLLALNDIKKEIPHSRIILNVIDSDIYDNIENLASKKEFIKSDIIFGPVYSNQLEALLRFMPGARVPIVSPFDPAGEHLTINNPNFFQVSTPLHYQQSHIYNGISRLSEVLVISEESGSDSTLIKTSKEILDAKGVKYRELSYNILKGREILPEILALLIPEKRNNIIVPSNSEAFVADVLRNLNLLQTRNGFPISVYGTPRWRGFESIDLNYYHSMNLHITSQYYADYSGSDVKEFVMQFRALYGAEPTPYAFLAYDIARFFLGSLLRYGGGFIQQAERLKGNCLQGDFSFIRKEGEAGFTNRAVRELYYRPDYSIEIKSFIR